METDAIKANDTVPAVLIVPCGMETVIRLRFRQALGVLIVPCGMETVFQLRFYFHLYCINCTLRNGNGCLLKLPL